jgi:integrase
MSKDTKITKRVVDALRPGSSYDVFKWDAGDGALKGFGVRVKPSGAASYLVQYRNKEGRTRRLVLGRVGELTPDQARSVAVDKLAAVRKGADPSAERHTSRRGPTVAEVCDWYLTEAKAGQILGRRDQPIKASTLAMDRSRIDCHVKPLLGRHKVAALRPEDIEKFQKDVAAGRTAKRKSKARGGRTIGGRGVAARTVGMLGTILGHAKIAQNPVRGVRRLADQKRRRFLSANELAALGKAMGEAECDGESRTGIAAIRGLLLTGCRRNEVLALRWPWLDAKARCIRFEDTKSGAQIRAIGTAAAAHLASQPRRDGCRWVFPSDRGDGHFVGLPRVLDRICARAKLDEVTVHTLRHSFGAAAAELGFSVLTIAGLLGHSVPGVTARYAHVPDSALLAAADRVAAHIAAALDGIPTAEVASLRQNSVGG